MTDNNFLLYLLIFFAAVNLVAFLLMLNDKIKSSRPDAERISEGLMFFLGAAFGALGIYAGMFAFRHKTRKWYFLLGIPLLLIENLALLYLIYQFLSANSF